jgi:predicted AAA+ superfamily ATPase
VLYTPRIIDAALDQLVSDLPAIAIEGLRAVGKTATATRRAATVLRLDDPTELTLVRADADRITRLPTPVLVDEWQAHPPVWDRVRRAVDAGAAPGSYLLTGSSWPDDAPLHSGAGRIVRLRMRPLALSERGLTRPTVSMAALLGPERLELGGDSPVTLADYAEEIVASGLPGIRALPPRARATALDGYLTAVVEHDFAELGHVVRRPSTLRAWLAAYAAASSTTTSYGSILDAATAGESDKPAKTTTIAYRETLERLWLLDEVPAWVGTRNDLASLGQAPKHQLADPALAARLLGAGAGTLLDPPTAHTGAAPRHGTLLGALFESLVTQSVRVYAEAHGARVSHLRTHRGNHEIDLVVTRDDGRMLAIEVKLAPTAEDADVRHLHWLKQHVGDDLLDAVVVTTGPAAYRRPDGIGVVPAALLGP